jgi:hypothetical protein
MGDHQDDRREDGAVEEVEQRRKAMAGEQEHEARDELEDEDHLERREGVPEPTIRLALDDQGNDSPQGKDGGKPHDRVTDELVDGGHAARSVAAVGGCTPLFPSVDAVGRDPDGLPVSAVDGIAYVPRVSFPVEVDTDGKEILGTRIPVVLPFVTPETGPTFTNATSLPARTTLIQG